MVASWPGSLSGTPNQELDADDFLIYPVLRMLSIVKGVNYPSEVKNYMQRMEQSTGVGLHLDQAA
ncbi:MAG: hypothetical protein WCX93_05060 [Burkholderiaceae bacterium]